MQIALISSAVCTTTKTWAPARGFFRGLVTAFTSMAFVFFLIRMLEVWIRCLFGVAETWKKRPAGGGGLDGVNLLPTRIPPASGI